MNILLVHNRYLERGGEDVSFEEEERLLLDRRHDVHTYIRDNHEILSFSVADRLMLPIRTIYAGDSYHNIRSILQEARISVCHFNNTFPLISPSAYDACRYLGVPVIQNLRNYRLICSNGYLSRDQRVCEDCVGKRIPWPAVIHACYRESHAQSTVVATMLAYHNSLGTWSKKVDAYVALTDFSRGKFIEGGLPADRIFVKPNFAYDRGLSEGRGAYALFVGRLSNVKGVLCLLEAWSHCGGIPLKIVGDGPLAEQMQSVIQSSCLGNVNLTGRLSSDETISRLKGGRFLIFPSVWYENFPRVLLESFSCGRPVVASNLGAATEIVRDGETGLLFNPGDPVDLAAKCQWLWDHPEESARMGANARREYEQKYTPERNYQLLMEIYSRAIAERNA